MRKLHRIVVATVVVMLCVAIGTLVAPTSVADKGPSYGDPTQPPTATTIVVQTSSPGGTGQPVSRPTGGGDAGPVCWVRTDFDSSIDPGLVAIFLNTPHPPNIVLGVQVCLQPDGTETRKLVTYNTDTPSPPPDAQVLANQVRAELPLQLDPPQTAPPTRSITGLPTWVWVPAADFHTVSASRTAGPLTVTVTATPASLTIDPGDGHTETCPGAGVPWHPGGSADDPGACTHTYTATSAAQPGGRYTLTATAEWQVSWTASDGQHGQLPPVRLANTTRLQVQQVQAELDP